MGRRNMASLSIHQAHHLVELTFPEYAKVRQTYWQNVNSAVRTYMEEATATDDWFKSLMRGAVELAFLDAALIAWRDGGQETDLTVSIIAFLTAYKLAEFGFIESLLLSLRTRKLAAISEEEPDELEEDLFEIQIQELARLRADGYAKTLDMLYNNIKVRAAGERILLFTGDDGVESCFDCQKYKGLKKPASWWVANNAVPPNRDFECKGYKCLHILMDVKTNKIFTL
jgi:hypothetical protein